jgi:4-amino-4-deoxy-L-arabinose transferase-like glycosyltransferase
MARDEHGSALGARESSRSASPLGTLLERGPVTRLELLGLLLLCVAVIVTAAWALRVPLLLGHDESVYATMARNWHSGGPVAGIEWHRAPLLPAVGVLVFSLGGDELALQGVGVAAALTSVLGVWWLGRMIQGPLTGLSAAAVFVFAPTVFRAGTTFLTDLPATALLVLLAGLLWSQFARRTTPNRLLLLAAPLAWGAYHLRYGSALPVMVLFATAALLFWPQLRDHARLVGQTVALLVLLLLPHLVRTTIDLGTPWGRLTFTSRIAGRDFLGQGLIEYLQWFPWRLGGPLAAAAMTLGLLAALRTWLGTRARVRRGAELEVTDDVRRGFAFLVLPAVAHLLLIGVASHGDPRFVFFSMAMLCVAGAAAMTMILRQLSRRSVLAVWVLLGLLTATLLPYVAFVARGEARHRDGSAERSALIVEAARTLRDLAGDDCSVLTTYVPQITWYAECVSHNFGSPPIVGREDRLTDDGWILLFEDGKRQPKGDVLDHYLAVSEPVRRWDLPHEGRLGSAVLYRVEVDQR